MRKWILLAAGLGLALNWTVHAQTQEDESRTIVAKAIKAMGGEEALAKQSAVSLRGRGKVDVGAGEFAFTMEGHTQFPDKTKAVIDLNIENMNFTLIEVFDGKKGWRSFMGETKPMDDDEVKEAKGMMYVERVMNLLELNKDKAIKLSPLGEMKVQGREAVGVQVKKEGERDVNLWFDKKDYLLLKSEYRAIDDNTMQEVNQEQLLSEYKEFDGVKAPAKLVINNNGKFLLEVEVTEMRCVGKHDPSMFAEPK